MARGAASAVSENNGLGRMNARQNRVGRAIGHTLSLVQSGAEIVGGVQMIGGGSAGAVVTSPAATTGVGAVLPAAGVGATALGVVTTVHGVVVGANTINNIFSQNNNNEQSNNSGQGNNNGHPDKDNTVQGAQARLRTSVRTRQISEKWAREMRLTL